MVPSEAPRLDSHDSPAHTLPTFSLDEIAKHGKIVRDSVFCPSSSLTRIVQDDAWIILDNKVYDVTSVLSWHPGQTHRCFTKCYV